MDLRLNPDVEIAGDSVAVRVRASTNVVATRVALVDVVLGNSCPDHSGGTGHEAPENLLERGKLDTDAREEGIEL